MVNGRTRVGWNEPPAPPGSIIRLTGGQRGNDGYYRVTHSSMDIGERSARHAYGLLPEHAWGIADPVQQRKHQIALSVLPYIIEVVDEHAPACRTCGELWPCTHAKNLRKLDNEIQTMETEENKRHQAKEQRRKFRARYETPGVCPACQSVVTTGQPSQTFEVNAVIPGGPPVTYHVSRKCGIDTRHHSMNAYQKRLKKKGQK